ncbi:hypothetical protein [Ideonella paludis]|uniref:hypothetical protein n=1 Tax=Ideonella paludis TaxID=1233411 RepID=UPI001B36CF66|nr:hypothetical protein [Ideonella paludis]
MGLHLLLLLAWLQHTGRITVATVHAPAKSTTLSWVLPDPTQPTAARPPAASPIRPSTAPPPKSSTPRDRQDTAPLTASPQPAAATATSTTLSLLPAASAPEPTAPSSTSMGALLRNDATRQALRQAGQQPLLAERTEAATGIAIQRQDTALAEGVKQGAKGDCLKGEFAGSGGGLLSLPALAYAAAAGKCAK